MTSNGENVAKPKQMFEFSFEIQNTHINRYK